MSATEAQIAAYVQSTGRNWKNICQALVYNICDQFGVSNRIYSSATAAYLDSNIRSRAMREAPMGAIHYWEYWATIGGRHANYGHVGVDTRGGGVGVMSTGRGFQIGNGAAIIDFQEWTNGMGKAVKYLGWALSNGQNAVTVVPSGSNAGGGETPVPEKPRDWDEMASPGEIKAVLREVFAERAAGAASIVPLTDDSIQLVSGITGRRAHIQLPYHVSLIQRVLNNNSNDMMLPAELDIVHGYLTAVNPPTMAEVDTDALAAALGEIDKDSDEATIEAAVRRALESTVTKIQLSIPGT